MSNLLTDPDLLEILGFEPVPEPEPAPAMLSWGIVGYRHFTDREQFALELELIERAYGPPGRVVSGGAAGADTLAREWAMSKNIPFTEHHPRAYTAQELLARNTLIVRDSDFVIAFLSTRSKGTLDTIKKAKSAGKKVVTIRID